MTTIELAFKKRHAAQDAIFATDARYKVLACGRRFGKTEVMVQCALLGSSPKRHGALQGKPVAYVSLTEKNVQEFWGRMMATLPKALVTYTNKVQKYIELVTGGSIECWTFENFVSARGRSYAGIILDEAAITPNLRAAWTEVFIAMLADYKGWAMLGSTPNGINYFEELYRNGQDDDKPDWASWQFTSYDNPHIDAIEFDNIRDQIDRGTFEREYLARFAVATGAVFSLSDDSVYTPNETAPLDNHIYVAGIDWGHDPDATVVSVFDVGSYREVALLRLVRMDYPAQVERIVEFITHWRVEKLYVEKNAVGLPNVQHLSLSLENVMYNDGNYPVLQAIAMTNKLKHDLVQALKRGLHENLMLLDDTLANNELRAMTKKQTASGLWTYTHPSGGHDDTVIARMLGHMAIFEVVT